MRYTRLFSRYDIHMNTKTPSPKKRGRKSLIPGETMVKVEFTVSARTLRLLDILSEGNRSKGVRESVELAYDRYLKTQ